jgi:hypothetical protein
MFSSGVGSWACAKIVVAEHGASNTKLLFMDTQIEDDDNYRFLHEATENVGAELVHLSDGRDPFQVYKDVNFMGNNRIDPCSRILKRELADTWIEENFTPDIVRVYVGIDWTEEHRFTRLAARKLPWIYEAPLCHEPNLMTKAEVLQWAQREGLNPPRMYAMGFQHANCGGFCIKSGQAQFKKMWENFPDRYLAFEQKEEEVYTHIGSRHPFIRKTTDGVMKYLSMREFRTQYLEPQCEIDEFDWGGCGCFSDAPEEET